MNRQTAKLIKNAQLVFGALALFPELGPTGSVMIDPDDASLFRVPLGVLLAWTKHLDGIEFSSHGDGDRWFVNVEGKLHGLPVCASAVVRHPETAALLANEPMSMDLLLRLQDLPQTQVSES